MSRYRPAARDASATRALRAVQHGWRQATVIADVAQLDFATAEQVLEVLRAHGRVQRRRDGSWRLTPRPRPTEPRRRKRR